MTDSAPWLSVLLVAIMILSLSAIGAGAGGVGGVQTTDHASDSAVTATGHAGTAAATSVGTAAASTNDSQTTDVTTDSTATTDGTAGTTVTPTLPQTVVDFNWPTTCPDQGVSDLDQYFDGDIGSSNSEFHVDDADGANDQPPDGGCVLRTKSESATITSIPGQQSSDLDYYPERGDELTFNHYIQSIDTIPLIGAGGSDFEFRFGVQDAQNYYYLRLAANNEPFEMQLGKVSGGTRTQFESTDIDIQAGVFQTVRIDWGADDPDQIEARFVSENAVNVVSATDTEFDGGGIGFYRAGTTGTLLDEFQNLVDTVDATVVDPSFNVNLASQDDTVAPGETATVTADIENIGGIEHTEAVEFKVDGEVIETRDVTVDSGYSGNWASTTESFSYTPSDSDAPAVDVEICATGTGDCATTFINVLQPNALTVDIVDTTGAAEGNPVEVTATVTNTGEVADTETQTLTVDVPGLGQDSTSVSLSGGEQTTETLSVSTSSGDAGEYTATASTDDDQDSRLVTVIQEGDIDVDIFTTNGPIQEGERFEASIEVVNTGATSATETITLEVPGVGTNSTEVSLNGGAGTIVTLSLQTSVGDGGEYTATVSSNQDSDTTGLDIRTQPNFTVNITDTPETVEGSRLDVPVEVTNTGEVADGQTIALNVSGLGSDDAGVALDGGETTNTVLSVLTTDGDVGSYTATVESEDDTATATATVLDAAEFTVEITDAPDIVAGEVIEVSANVTNVGATTGTETATLSIGSLTESTTVSLAGGESTTTTFSIPTTVDDAGNYTATVTIDDDQASTQLQVLEVPNFQLDVTDVTDSVVGGENVSMTITVENTGEASDTQTAVLNAPGLGNDTAELTLDGGESTTATLAVPTGAGDAGNYTATVATQDDQANRSVTVLEPANFTATLVDTTAPVEAGTSLDVTVEVTNVGEVSETQTVEVDIPGLGTDTTTTTLAGNETTTETLSVSTSPGDAGDYTATASTDDDQVSTNVTVLAKSELEVNITGTTTPIEAGTPLEVTVNVSNTGEVTKTQTVALDAGGLGTDETEITLGGGNETTTVLSVATSAGDAGEYTATVSSANDTETTNVTVLAQTDFAVNITTVTGTVTEGETVEVTAEVTNTGGVSETQTVTLDAGALGTNSTSVSLDGGNNTTVTLSVPTSAGDGGSYTATVSTADDSDSAAVTVLAPANFTVAVADTSSPVEGAPLNVTVDIENVGDFSATQTIDVAVGALGSNSTSVTLSGGATTTETFSFPTGADDAGTYTATATSANDSASREARVLAAGAFDVDIVDTTEPVANETLSVTVDVTNTGDTFATKSINLSIPGLGNDSIDWGVVGGSTTSVTLSVSTSAGDAGNYTATVESDSDAENVSVRVFEEPSLAVDIVSANDTVEGEFLTVTADVTNVGEGEGSQTLTLSADGLGSIDEDITVGAGETITETLNLATRAFDAGEYTVNVSTADDFDTANATVFEPANFELGIVSANDTVEGSPVEVTANVTNTGGVEGTQTMELDLGALGTATKNLTVGPDNETLTTLSVPTSAGDAGEYTATVSSEDDSATANVTVLTPANFTVALTSTTTPVDEGKNLTVTAAIENVGGANGTQTVELDAGALGNDTTTVSLAGGNVTTVALSVPTSAGDIGEYAITVSSANDSATTNVTVIDAPEFDITSIDANTPVAGAALNVTATIENVGGMTDTQTVELNASPLGTDTTTVTLDAGNETTTVLSVATSADDAGTYTPTMTTDNDSENVEATVLAPAAFAVEILDAPSPVEGDELDVTAEVTNTGDVAGSTTANLSVGALGENGTTVSLNAERSTTVTLSVPTSEGDAGEYTATVSAGNGSDSQTIRVLTPGSLVVDIVDTTQPVVGDPLAVTAEVENVGGVQTTQALALDAGALGTNSTTVTVDSGATVTRTLSVPTTVAGAGTYTVNMSTENDTATTDATVLALGSFAVEIANVNEPEQGEPLEVTVNVTNTGDVAETQDISLTVPALGTNATTVSLGGGNTTAVTLSVETLLGDYGAYTLSVASEDDQVIREIGVNLPIIAGGNPPLDPDNDGQYEDVRGDGTVDVFDVQALFANLGNDAVQRNAGAFAFQGSASDGIRIFDVQALFTEVTS